VPVQPQPTVALLIETSRAYGRGLCTGVAEYARNHGGWNFLLQERDLREGIPEWLPGWQGDGILCRVSDPALAELLSASACPVVDLYGGFRHPAIPFLDTDAAAVARMAARFFLDAAFDRFAFCGFPGLWFSDERCGAYVAHLRELGFACHVYQTPDNSDSGNVAVRESLHPSGSGHLEEWVISLPDHTAILACNDVRAQQLLTVAGRVGRRIPEELAVMGVDDDELICELTNPRLSSIRPDTRSLGYHAAQWLETLMRGKPLPARQLLLPPLRINERASTDVIASIDPVFIRASRYIRSHAGSATDVCAVAAAAGCSRSSLEMKFDRILGRSVHDEIIRVRIRRACILLAETHLTLDHISTACGFATASHFSRVFKSLMETTPGDYRMGVAKHRLPATYPKGLFPST
jgi:LacI family transcriptional regulator